MVVEAIDPLIPKNIQKENRLKRTLDQDHEDGDNDIKKAKMTAPSTNAESSKHAGAADDVVVVPEDDDLIMVNWTAGSSIDRFLQNKTWHVYSRH